MNITGKAKIGTLRTKRLPTGTYVTDLMLEFCFKQRDEFVWQKLKACAYGEQARIIAQELRPKDKIIIEGSFRNQFEDNKWFPKVIINKYEKIIEANKES